MKICSVEECTREVCAKGLCEPHYRRMRRLGSPTDGTWFRMTMVEVCSVESCGRSGYAKGYCQRHYQRHAKYGNAEEPTRQVTEKTLEAKIAEGTPTGLDDTECWEWSKSRNREKYGVIPHGGKHLRAHRATYELANGTKIPKGLVIRHKCDNPPCVNPKHLELGTHADNVRDRVARGRSYRRVDTAASID